MRKLALAVALATTAMASPALARDDSWYIGAQGGVTITQNIKFKARNAERDYRRVGREKSKTGWTAGGFVGYDFGKFRVEAEGGYRQTKVKRFYGDYEYASESHPKGYYSEDRNAKGKTKVGYGMVNAMFDFGDDDKINASIGGGVGVGHVKFSKWRVDSSASSFLNKGKTRFAWQALAAVRFPVSDKIDLGISYKYFSVQRVRVRDYSGNRVRGNYHSHNILGTIAYNFGNPPPPPPPPPPPIPPETPPPPPPPAVCTPGPFLVFFDWNKADITPEASSILDNAVASYSSCGNASVLVSGYTDSSGTPQYNMGLSIRRADNVSNYMQSRGVPGNVITSRGLGETNQLVPTADGVREVKNRRVEIIYGPGN